METAGAVVQLRGRDRAPPVLPVAAGRGTAAGGELLGRLTGLRPLVARGELHFVLAHMLPSARRAREELGWAAVPFLQGLAQTLEDMARPGTIPAGRPWGGRGGPRRLTLASSPA